MDKETDEGEIQPVSTREFLKRIIILGVIGTILAILVLFAFGVFTPSPESSSCPLQKELAWDCTQNWDGTWDVLVKGEVWNTGDWEGVDSSGLKYRKGTVKVTITDTLGQRWVGWINFRVYDTEGQNPKTIQKWFRGFEYKPVECQGRVMCGWHE